MKLITLTYCLALAFPGLALATDIPIPLENPGFESGLTGWTSEPADLSDILGEIPEAALLGDKGLRVKSTEPIRFTLTSTAMPVKPGKTYTVTFWGGKGGAAPEDERREGVGVKMQFQDDRGAYVKEEMAKIRKWPGVQVKGDTYANPYILAAAAPEGATTLTLVINSSGKAAIRPVDIDDFQVKELSDEPPPPILPGQGHPIPPFDPARVKSLEDEVAANPTRGGNPPRIVLKLDDFGVAKGDGVHPRWMRVADFCREKGIKVTFGIIATRMTQDAPKFAAWTKEQHAAGRIEFWCHGWDHAERKEGDKRIMEFSGEPLEHQRQHLVDANKLALEKLGFEYVSFGAPFNATDENTVPALAAVPSIRVWMYGPSGVEADNIVILERSAVSIESPSMIPNYADFLEGYAHNRGADYFVMQGHPAAWGEDRWEQFVKIVDFLIARKANFVFASDFAR